MFKFECNKCGTCCSHLLSYQNGLHHGMYLSSKESELFPKEVVSPLFRYGETIIAYQVTVNRCPHLNDDNSCFIYERRPLFCRAFPLMNNDLLCPVIIKHKGEELDLSVMQGELRALKEQEQEAESMLEATGMYLIDKHEWIENKLGLITMVNGI